MYVLVDMTRLVFVYRHEHPHTLSNVASLELVQSDTRVLPCDNPWDFDVFTDTDIKLLFKNTTGADHKGYSREYHLQTVCELANRVPLLDAVPEEAHVQAMSVGMGDKGFYRYVKGGRRPAPVDELFLEPVKLPRNQQAEQQALKTALQRPQATGAPTPWPFPDSDPAARSSTPRAPRAPRTATASADGTAPSAPGRPKAGSTTGRVWDIADTKKGSATGKDLRKAVIAACEAEGINPSTASVQFGKWLAAQDQPQ